MKPTRDPFGELDDRTPDELAAVRALAADLDALLDAPPLAPIVVPPEEEDEELDITRDAMPLLPTTASVPIVADLPPDPVESGLAERMRGVLRGVLDRSRKNKKRQAR